LLKGGADEIGLEEVERELAVQAPPEEPLVTQDLPALPLREAREQLERTYLQQPLLLCNGKVGLLAKRVGMERTHLYRKLRSLGVEFRNISDDWCTTPADPPAPRPTRRRSRCSSPTISPPARSARSC